MKSLIMDDMNLHDPNHEYYVVVDGLMHHDLNEPCNIHDGQICHTRPYEPLTYHTLSLSNFGLDKMSSYYS